MKFAVYLALCAWIGACLAGAVHSETLTASYYGSESGTRTASGEAFRPEGLTAAMPGAGRSIPFGARVRVCRAERCVVVRVNDVGPARRLRRGIDLSHGAAVRIGLVGVGVGRVEVERMQ